jgi:hypothetical protein
LVLPATASTPSPAADSGLNFVSANLVVRLESLLALIFAQDTCGLDTALEPAEHLLEALTVSQDYLHPISFRKSSQL